MTTTEGPQLTVVMPSYNQGRFITDAIRSVLAQSGPETELVVADGGSTDDTLDRLAALGDEFPERLRWSSEPDGGPAEAINKAAALARGDVLGWLNSDDLYATGAIEHALAHLQAHPEHVMVYGQGQHIDADGKPLNIYPTQPPDVGMARFADGCFICQPTVFFRRQLFEELGGLDTSLKTAFDFEFWLRVFKRDSQRIGFLDRLQACSRLHDDCITRRLRRRVLIEGMTVIHRHLGTVPGRWATTLVEEVLLGEHPNEDTPVDLAGEIDKLDSRIGHFMTAEQREAFREEYRNDQRIQLARPEVALDVTHDGWARPVLTVHVREFDEPLAEVVLHCHNAAPLEMPLALSITPPSGNAWKLDIPRRTRFELSLPVVSRAADESVAYKIETQDYFIPAQRVADSADSRQLAFIVEDVTVKYRDGY